MEVNNKDYHPNSGERMREQGNNYNFPNEDSNIEIPENDNYAYNAGMSNIISGKETRYGNIIYNPGGVKGKLVHHYNNENINIGTYKYNNTTGKLVYNIPEEYIVGNDDLIRPLKGGHRRRVTKKRRATRPRKTARRQHQRKRNQRK